MKLIATTGLLLTLTSASCQAVLDRTSALQPRGGDYDDPDWIWTEIFRERPPKDYEMPALPVVVGTRLSNAELDPAVADEFQGILRALYSSGTTALLDTGWIQYARPRSADADVRGYALLADFGAEYEGYVVVLELDHFTVSAAGASGISIKSGRVGSAQTTSEDSQVDCRATVRLEHVTPAVLKGVAYGVGTFAKADSRDAAEASAKIVEDIELAGSTSKPLTVDQLPNLRRVLDEAIAEACQELCSSREAVKTLKGIAAH
jgi:hypothetical protein